MEKEKVLDIGVVKIDDVWSVWHKRWRAEGVEKYYFLNNESEIQNTWECKTKEDEARYNLGNYFKTEEEAEKVKVELNKFWEKVRNGEIGD